MFNCESIIRDFDIAFDREERIFALQDSLFRKHIYYAISNSPFYKKKFRSFNIRDITLDRLHQLPFTSRDEFVEYNDDFIAICEEDIVDISLSSGTTGVPTKIVYSREDLARLAYSEHKSLLSCGIDAKDRVLLSCTMDRCFIAGLAYFLGLSSIGASVIRNGINSIENYIAVIERFRPKKIIGVPSFLVSLGRAILDSRKRDILNYVDGIVCIGESIRDENFLISNIGKELKNLWGAKLFSTYASSECATAFCECSAGQGGHLNPDLAVVEIVDDAGNVLEDGKIGEVVLTPLQVKGMPLIRFRTGDISFLISERCSCGRRSCRLGPILGRKQQKLKVKGTTIYPEMIYRVLDGIPEISCYYLEVSSDLYGSDIVDIIIALNSSLDIDYLIEKLQATLRFKPNIRVEDEKKVRESVFQKSHRKPIKFIDKRNCPM